MSLKTKFIGISKALILLILIFILVITSGYAFRMVADGKTTEQLQYTLVEGNVDQPGYYRITEFTTNLDLLERAGLNDSSNIRHIDLIQSANPRKTLEVGVSKEKVKPREILDFSNPQILYFMGDVSVKRDFNTTSASMKQVLQERDIMMTRVDGKARIVFSNLTEIDVNPNTKIKMSKLDIESTPSVTMLQLYKGQVWIKVPKATPGANFVIITPTAKIELEGGAAELVISVRAMESSVYTEKGTANISRIGRRQKILLQEQQAVIAKQGEHVLESVQQKFTKETIMASFGDIEAAYKGYIKTQKEVSVLLTNGHFNQVLSMLPEKNRIVFMDLPGNTYVGDYMEGVIKLDQAVAFSGSELTREIVQRIIGRPVQFVARINMDVVAEFTDVIGGLELEVDAGAAFAMRISAGIQRLTGEQVLKFLNTRLPGGDKMAINRQKMVMMAFHREVKKGDFYTYSNILIHMLQRMPVNMTIKEGMEIYSTYSKNDNWSIMNISLPSTKYVVGQMVLVKPEYSRIHQYYN